MFKLNDIESKGFEAVTAGTYEVFPSEVALKYGATSGNPYLSVNYTIRDDVEQNHKGRKINFDSFFGSEAAMWRIRKAGEAAGMDMDKQYGSLEEWGKDFKNRPLRVKVAINDKGYPDVKDLLPSEHADTFISADDMDDIMPF